MTTLVPSNRKRSPIPIEGIAHNNTGYTRYGCGCDTCREAHRIVTLKSRLERRLDKTRSLENLKHPSHYAYSVGCRCAPCVAAQSQRNRRVQYDEPVKLNLGTWSKVTREGESFDVIHWPPSTAERPWTCPDCNLEVS